MDQRVVLGRAAGAAKRAARKAARDAGTAPLPKAGAARRARKGSDDTPDEQEPTTSGPEEPLP